MLNTSSVRRRFTLVVLAAALAAPSLLAGQNKFSFTPWLGSYYPLAKFYDNTFDLSTVGGSGTVQGTEQQGNTVMFGARITIPIGATLAAEGSFGYAQSDVRLVLKNAVNAGLDASTNLKGRVLIGSLRAVLKPRRSNLSLIAGAIVVNHGGDAWNFPSVTKKTTVGGVAGIGLRANVTPRFPIDIRAEVNLYNFNPDKSDDTAAGFLPGKFQQDLVISVGIPIGGR